MINIPITGGSAEAVWAGELVSTLALPRSDGLATLTLAPARGARGERLVVRARPDEFRGVFERGLAELDAAEELPAARAEVSE